MDPTSMPVHQEDKMEALAIIGFSAHLPPDNKTSQDFWKFLCEGRSARCLVPEDRFNIDSFYHSSADRLDTTNVKHGYFLESDLKSFDAPFFSIQPTEVTSMDPQQRCLLEASYRAFENAGMPMENVSGSKTSVFVGAASRDYESILLSDPAHPSKYTGTGVASTMLANRISWFFNLKGPSVSLDTACSSSLTAFHLGCQSLRTGEASVSLIGGCNLILYPDTSMIHLSNLGFFSPDGKCYAFDAQANGYAKGEGYGMVVIKRLNDALRDDDTIRAVVRASGANQDGRTPGITQPSQQAQTTNIIDTYTSAGLDVATTGFVETHGTGTQIGDSIEANAFRAAFPRDSNNPLYLGALKTNIGHLEAASGLASLVKSILVLETGTIPPNVWYKSPNPSIPLEDWNFKIPTTVTPWPKPGLRRLSLNSFGFGGSNVHVILEDAYHYLTSRGLEGKHQTLASPSRSQSKHTNPASPTASSLGHEEQALALEYEHPQVFVWSTSDEAGIRRMAEQYHNHLCDMPAIDDSGTYLNYLAYTLSQRRSKLPWKSFVIARSIQHLKQGLTDKFSKPLRSSTPPVLGFVFTGQGAQWHAMGRELSVYPIYSSTLQECDSILRGLECPWSLQEELRKGEHASLVHNPAFAQPLCTAVQIALVRLLDSWNIKPSAVVGHSSGEIAAAFCIGAISQDAAMRIAYYRGKLASSLAASKSRDGTMISVAMSEADVTSHIAQTVTDVGHGSISIGCVNSGSNCTITGDRNCIQVLENRMTAEGIFARILNVPVAYHSTHMEDIAADYSQSLHNLEAGTIHGESRATGSEISMFSSVTGLQIDPTALLASDYWVKNMTSKVKFFEAFHQFSAYLLGCQISGAKQHILEVGPHAALQRIVKDNLKETSQDGTFEYSSLLSRDTSASLSALEITGRLHCKGYPVDLGAVNSVGISHASLQTLVDLPEYPFNHTTSYWEQGRLSQSYCFRKVGRHDFLGTPTTDWIPSEPKWRHIIRISENSWVKDHTINGSIIYPAAGMITMAVEGARQVADGSKMVSAYRVTDIVISRALILDDTHDAVETQLHFRPKRSTATDLEVRDFVIYAWLNEVCEEICHGRVTTIYSPTKNEQSQEKLLEDQDIGLRDKLRRNVHNCRDMVASDMFYDNLVDSGYEFGPSFKQLRRLRYSDNGDVDCDIRFRHWQSSDRTNQDSHVVIHPTDLDAILQVGLVSVSKGSFVRIPCMVPTKISSVLISHELLYSDVETRVPALATLTFQGYREADMTVMTLDEKNMPSVVVEGLRITAAGHLNPPEPDATAPRLCYHLTWKHEPGMLTNSQKKSLMTENISGSARPAEVGTMEEVVCLYYMAKVLKELDVTKLRNMPFHLKKYAVWIDTHLKTLRQSSDKAFSQLLEQCGELHMEDVQEQALTHFLNSTASGRLIQETGMNLLSVLHGECDPLEIMFNDNRLAEKFYHSQAFHFSYQRIASYIDVLAHKNPELRVLEIGAGTGAATVPIIESLAMAEGLPSIPRFSKYTYTDISPAFFEQAKAKFARFSSIMEFKVLDIEKDVVQQGIETEYYDVVVCSLVVHATATISKTLTKARSLLKPGGQLVLFEPTNPSVAWPTFSFGLLSGWWLGTEEKRQSGPLLSPSEWTTELLSNCFTGIDVWLPDNEQPDRQDWSIIVSTVQEQKHASELQPPVGSPLFFIVSNDSLLQRSVAEDLKSILNTDANQACDTITIGDISSTKLEGALCIFLVELEQSLLVDMSSETFEALQTTLSNANAAIWVTQAGGQTALDPKRNIIAGLGRNVASENINMTFVQLSLEVPSTAARIVSRIMEVYKESLCRTGNEVETEFREVGGQLQIPRMMEATSLNGALHKKLIRQMATKESLNKEPQRALRLTIGSPGLLDTLHFEDDPTYESLLGDHEVEMRVQAVGVNFRDVMIATGSMTHNSLGAECSGVVTRTGKAVAGFVVGDRIMCASINTAYSTFVRADASALAKMPADMAFTTAAAIPIIFCTAYYALVNIANIQAGESVLIHSGAGGLGQAAIQIAMDRGAVVFTTVGSVEKKELVMELYGISEDHIFSSRGTSFVQGVLQRAGSVDVVLNSLSGEGLRASWSCIAPFGRFIELGKADIQMRNTLPMAEFARNVTFSSVDLMVILDKAKPLIRRVFSSVLPLLTRNEKPLQAPRPLTVYDVSSIEEAFRSMQSGKSTGKLIIEFGAQSEIPVVPSMKFSTRLEGNATYLISGGLGGLGRSIVRWMVNRGARHFLLCSRSGATSKDAIELVGEISEAGIDIKTPACDITNRQVLKNVLEQHSATMPPIKGCIQASMVIKDGLFQTLDHNTWNAVLAPKVHGSWNLHELLPRNLSFFVLLSSVAGITGTRGQSSYAAANTYQDALARHRISNGERAYSLNLGVITGVGYAAENNVYDLMKRDSFAGIPKAELFAYLDHCCDSTMSMPSSPDEAELVTGLSGLERLSAEQAQENYWARQPLFSILRQINATDTINKATEGVDENVTATLEGAKSDEEAVSIVSGALLTKLCKVLSLPVKDLDMAKPIHAFGVDSLVALEIRYWFMKEVKADLAIFEIMGTESLLKLSELGVKKTTVRASLTEK